jgi:hypothetical protein
MRRPKIVRVKWDDSAAPRGWQRMDELVVDIVNVDTVGFLVAEDRKTVTVAVSYVADEGQEQACGMVTIPKSAIKKMRTLK